MATAMAERTKSAKMKKPREDFPLFPHPRGYWAKKIRGKAHYFGRYDEDPKGVRALAKYLAERDDLEAGRIPRAKVETFTVRDLVNRFLTTKRCQVERGDLKPRTFSDYHKVCARLVNVFGPGRAVVDLGPDDFEKLRTEISKGRAAYTVKGQVIQSRTIFVYAYENRLIDRPVVFGQAFSIPTAKEIRRARRVRGVRLFEAAEIRTLIDKASIPVKAMVLLGINCGFGNTDLSELQESSIDWTEGREVIDFPRPKTGVERRCPLWSETVQALKHAIIERPKAKSKADEGCAFLTLRGRRLVLESLAEIEDAGFKARRKVLSAQSNAVSREFRKLLDEAQIDRNGLSFYTLRHVFRTVADEIRDRPAIDRIMGHEPVNDVSVFYRERIDDARLRAVTDYVRAWLFPEAPAAIAKKGRQK
jgi:integrase